MHNPKLGMNQHRKRVLIVDDDEEILDSTSVALQESGYEVITASDGSQALMRAERDLPDLIILDIVMPKRSGFSVLKQLRRGNSRRPRILVITGNPDSRHQEFAEAQGADAFLRKPFDIDELLTQVDKLVHD